MKPLPNNHRAGLSSLAKLLLLMVSMLVGFIGYYTGEPHQTLADQPFAPFLNILPSEDGDSLFISAANPEITGAVYADVGVGGGNHKGGAMVYSNTVQSYLVTVDLSGAAAGSNLEDTIRLTTTTGLDTGTVFYNRAYVPASSLQTINSVDLSLQLNLLTSQTITANTYIVVTPSFGPPGPLPPGRRLAGQIYSVRASGALPASGAPMNLRLYFDETSLAGADPHTLAIFAWDASNHRWDNLGGARFLTQGFVSVATSRFTAYALMAADNITPTVAFAPAAYSITEGAGAATITTTLSGMSTLPVTITYATDDGTAIAGSDYLTATGVLTFAPGQTSRTFPVIILDDSLNELAETLTLRLTNPVNAVLSTPSTATLTLMDNDPFVIDGVCDLTPCIYLPLILRE